MIKVLVFPKDPNPYQTLLQRELAKLGVHSQYFFEGFLSKHAFTLGFPLFYLRLLFFRIRGYRIFHIHWTFSLVVPFPNSKLSKIASFYYAIFFLISVKLFGYKLVWTVHDILPHKQETINDLVISNILSKLTDRKIILYKSAQEEMKILGLDTKDCVTIPHGNYMSHYPNTVGREYGRKVLGLNNNEFVFLYIGIIDTYKGITDLLLKFSQLKEKNVRLIIAGKCIDTNFKKNIQNYSLDKRIIIHLGHIQDDKIQIYLNASDIVVLPFKNLTNSGSALLAISFAKPIIAPRLGSIEELPPSIGYFYEIGDLNGLIKAMKQSLAQNKLLKQKGESAYRYGKTLSWDRIAKLTYYEYSSLINNL